MSSDAMRNRLLHILILKNTVALAEASEVMGSEKEVLYYINELNNLFSGKIRIHIAKDTNEIILNIIGKDSFFRDLYSFGIHDFNDSCCRMAYIMKELIEKEEYLNIMDISENMNVSRGTVNNDLRRTKKNISKYNAEIIGVTNRGIKIHCDEFNKRLMLIHEVFDYFPIISSLNQSLIDAVCSISDYYGLNNSARLLFFKTVLVTVHRAKQEKVLSKSIPMYKNFEQNNKVFIGFIDNIQKEFLIKLSREDIDFISFPINTRSSAYTDKTNNFQNEELLKDIVYKMVGSVKEKFMIHIHEEDFFLKVKYHLLFLINRLIFKIPLKDIFSSQIKIRFPLAFELAKISMHVLYEEYKLVGTKVDIGYLAVYFALILDERKSPDDNKRNRHAAVITNMGMGVFQLIKKQLLEILGFDAEIDLLTLQELKTSDVAKYGIIFTTENLISDVHLPLVHINGIIDYSALSEKLREMKGVGFNSANGLAKKFDFNIFEIRNGKSYKECVGIIVDNLNAFGYATENIFTEFERKERISSMLYENGVAFPHLTAKSIDRLNLTLGIIKSKEKNLKLIFFLLIPEDTQKLEENILMKIYDEIFTIISDKNLISELVALTAEKDILSFLKERKLLI